MPAPIPSVRNYDVTIAGSVLERARARNTKTERTGLADSSNRALVLLKAIS